MDLSNFQNDLGRFLFREVIDSEEATQLASLAQYIRLAPGTVILKEGASNHALYFLLEGNVSGLRAGEEIATLVTPGDVLGEMSLITQKPCSTTCLTTTETLLLVLEINQVQGLSVRLKEQFSNALNRLFAVILAKKLAITNEKARLFEITNRELQQAKIALETASADKIGELSSNQRSLAGSLHALLSEEIGPIRKQLENLQSHAGTQIIQTLERLEAKLLPLSRLYVSDSSLTAKKVLLAEDNLDERINAKMSLGGTGVDLTVVSDLESAKKAVSDSQFDIICLNNLFVDLIPLVARLYPETQFVFMTSEAISEHFQTLRSHPELTTILARHPQDRTFTVKNTATTIRKLTSSDIFGMEKYLSWGTEIHEEKIVDSDQRERLIECMQAKFESLDLRKQLVNRCARVAEELMMNVLYDAPTDRAGKALFNHLPRTIPVKLEPGQTGKFRYACDGVFVGVSAEDPFGGLTRPIILDYLERCFSGTVGEELQNKGGGGNGLFQIIQSSSLVIFNVQPKVRTEVIALFNVNTQFNKISFHPSFHFFEAPQF